MAPVGEDRSPFARGLVQLIESLGDKYQVEELAAKYTLTGRTPLTIPEALAVKAELEQIDALIKQLEEARETAQIAIVDMDALAEFTEPGDLEKLQQMQQMVEDYRRNRDLVFQRLAAMPKVSLSRPEGAFYAFFAVDGVTDSVQFAQRLIDETGVGLAPGRAFGPSGEGRLRLCFAAEAATLSTALDRLAPALS